MYNVSYNLARNVYRKGLGHIVKLKKEIACETSLVMILAVAIKLGMCDGSCNLSWNVVATCMRDKLHETLLHSVPQPLHFDRLLTIVFVVPLYL